MSKKTPKKESHPQLNVISYANQGLTNLSSVSIQVPIDTLELSGNPIKNFFGLKVLPSINIIECSNTQLNSFYYFPQQEGVKSFFCYKTSLAGHQSLNVMCAIVFGDSLESVNGTLLNSSTKKMASIMKDEIRPLLVNGWIIQNFDPVCLVNTSTRQRKTFFFDFNEPSNHNRADKENLTETNENHNSCPNENEQEVYLISSDDEDVYLNILKDEQNEHVKSIQEIDAEGDEIELKSRFMKLQEVILNEMKRPDIISNLSKSGRTTAASTRPSTALKNTPLQSPKQEENKKRSPPKGTRH